jgi:hypothetical protein
MSANITTNQILKNAVKCLKASNQYITLPTTVFNPLPSDVFSISMWFYCTALDSTNQRLYLVGNMNASQKGFDLLYYTPNNSLFIQFEVSNGGNTNGMNFKIGNQTSMLNKWHHVVFTKNGLSNATWNMYLDGVLLAGVSSTNTLLSGDTVQTGVPVQINATGNAASFIADSYFSNYQFYNRALTATEALGLYRFPMITVSGLTANYKFSEHNGQTIVDSVSANNGSLISFTSGSTATPPALQSGNTTWYEYLSVPNNPIII